MREFLVIWTEKGQLKEIKATFIYLLKQETHDIHTRTQHRFQYEKLMDQYTLFVSLCEALLQQRIPSLLVFRHSVCLCLSVTHAD